jgi:hypothetical protein
MQWEKNNWEKKEKQNRITKNSGTTKKMWKCIMEMPKGKEKEMK